jgi:hypothetical protein
MVKRGTTLKFATRNVKTWKIHGCNGKIEVENVSTPKGGNENRFQMLQAFIITSQTY